MGNKVFISHASRDYRDSNGKIIEGNAISQIIKVLDDNNIERWIDESGLVSAKGWCEQLKEAIDECNIVLFVSSHNANRSDNTANEISYAYKNTLRWYLCTKIARISSAHTLPPSRL